MAQAFRFFAIFVCVLLSAGLATASGVAGGTVVVGTVSFEGTPPRVQKRPVNSDRETCGIEAREFHKVRVDEKGALRDVVIYLDSEIPDRAWEHPAAGYVLNQKGCTFEPYILLYSNDPAAKLTLANSDPALHNVRIAQVIGRVQSTVLNLSMNKGSPPKLKGLRLKESSNILHVKCDVHDFMEAWIFAADNPFCVVVEEDGSYELFGLPPGDHVIGAWHPYLGTQSVEITVVEGQQTTLDFRFEAGAGGGRRPRPRPSRSTSTDTTQNTPSAHANR